MISKDALFRYGAPRSRGGRGDYFLSTGAGSPPPQGVFDWGTIFRIGTEAFQNLVTRRPQLPPAGGGQLPAPQLPQLPDILTYPLPGLGQGGIVQTPRLGRASRHTRSGIPVFGVPHRSRRLNVCNPHALRRAGRRIKGFVKMYHRVEKSLPHRTTHKTMKVGKRGRCAA